MSQFIYLRNKTEEGFQWKTVDLSSLSTDSIKKIIQDYYIAQIDLEKQNKSLTADNQKLNAKLSQYSELYENAPFGLFLLDKNGLIRELNKTALKLLSIEKEQVLGKPFHLYISREDLVVFYMLRSKAISAKTRQVGEINIQKKDGVKIPVQINCISLQDEKDEFGKLQITVFDFTEVKQIKNTLNKRYEFEKIISALSRRFITLSSEQLDNAINQSLKIIANFAGVERSFICIFLNKNSKVTMTHEWCAEGISPQISQIRNQSVDLYPQIILPIKKMETFQIPNIDTVPLEDKLKMQDFLIIGTKSFIATPMIYQKDVLGMIGYDSKATRKIWPDDLITLLKITGDIIASAIVRKLKTPGNVEVDSLLTDNGKKEIEICEISEFDIEELSITEVTEDIVPKDPWGFIKKKHIDSGTIDSLAKAFVKSDNTLLISCPQCLRHKTVSTNEIQGLGNLLEVTCPCNFIFDLRLEYRKAYRKKINLDGVFTRKPISKLTYQSDEEWGRIHLENISIKGAGFTTSANNEFKVGEEFRIKFTLDDELCSVINVRVIVRSVRDNYVGCEFLDSDKHGKTLGFYLKG